MKQTKKRNNLVGRITGSLALAVALFAAGRANAAHELLYGIEISTDNLISFYSDAPSTILASRSITGIQAAESVRGIDFSSDGKLYALGSSSRLYTIDPNTGAATQVGSGQFSTLLNGSAFGMDIGATGVRVISDLGQALLINTGTGVATVQASPVYAAGDPNFGQTPAIDALAFNPATGGWVAGNSLANSFAIFTPGTGALNTIGPAGIDFARNNGLDFSSTTGILYLGSPAASSDPQANLYTTNPLTGAVTLVGQIGHVGDNILLNGLTVSIVPEPSSLGLLALGGALFAVCRRKR
jgi:WD40 repeat protein